MKDWNLYIPVFNKILCIYDKMYCVNALMHTLIRYFRGDGKTCIIHLSVNNMLTRCDFSKWLISFIKHINNYDKDDKKSPPYKISISGYRLNLIFLEEGGFLIYFYSRKIGIYIYFHLLGKRWKNGGRSVMRNQISAFGIKDGLTWQFITSPVALYTGCRLNSLMAAEVEARFRPGPNDRVNFDRSWTLINARYMSLKA